MAGIIFFATPTGPIWYPDSSGIKTFAEDQIERAVTRSDSFIRELYDKLEELSDELAETLAIPLLEAELADLSVSMPAPFTRPDKPVRPDFLNDYPAPPPDAVLGTVSEIVLDDVPVLTAVAPTVRTITPPTPFTGVVPTSDPIPTRSFPVEPGYTLPTAKTLRELTLPTAPSLISVSFEGILPTALASPPDVDFQFTEAEYQSALNDELKDKLLSLVLNTHQTGLSNAVTAQMRDKAREFTAAQSSRRRAAVRRQFAGMGWSMPQGDEAIMLRQAEEGAIVADITESRNIFVETARLEQANFQFAFTQAIALEAQLLNLHNNVQQREFDAAKYEIEALVSLFQLQVAYHNAGVTLYTAQASVYRDRIQAELAKIELYKGELEGQKLIGELNSQDIANYKAQIEAVVALFDLYKSRLESVKIQMEGDGLKIQQFEANIRAFAEQIRAKSLEYEGYKAELSGEQIQADIYNALVNAFGKEIDAYIGTTDAKMKKLDADVKVNFDVPLETLKQRNEVYKLQIESKNTQNLGLAKIYETDGQVYAAESDAEKSIIESELKRMELDLAYISKDIDVKTDVFAKNVSVVMAQKDILISARETQAKLKAQIIAGITSSVNFGASITGSSAYKNAEPEKIVY